MGDHPDFSNKSSPQLQKLFSTIVHRLKRYGLIVGREVRGPRLLERDKATFGISMEKQLYIILSWKLNTWQFLFDF